MEYETVISERSEDGRIGIMTLNRPEKFNAWNHQIVDDMISCLEDFKKDENMGVVIVKGGGRHFSAGLDFTTVLDQPGDAILSFFRKAIGIRTIMHTMPQITIAEVHGIAAAFGIHLVWFSDLAIASEDASFGAPPINIGFGWCFGEPEFRFMGPKVVNDITLLGTMYPASEAKRLGIVNQVVKPEELSGAVMKMANQLLSKNPWALARMKWLNYQQAELTQDAALDLAMNQVSIWLQLADVKEGVRAFLEKRKADYAPFRGKVKPVV